MAFSHSQFVCSLHGIHPPYIDATNNAWDGVQFDRVKLNLFPLLFHPPWIPEMQTHKLQVLGEHTMQLSCGEVTKVQVEKITTYIFANVYSSILACC